MAKTGIGFVGGVPENPRVDDAWRKEPFAFATYGTRGKGFVHNCKIERSGTSLSAPTVHSTEYLTHEQVESKFGDFVEYRLSL